MYAIRSYYEIEILRELHWPDSLGLLYSAFTYYTGFKVNSGEYKVMGLAPYGEPKFVTQVDTNGPANHVITSYSIHYTKLYEPKSWHLAKR